MKVTFYLVVGLLLLSSVTKAQTGNSNELLLKLADEVNKKYSDTPVLNEDIHSLLVSKNGILEAEYYYNGFTKDSLNNIKSVTKSIVGLLVGIAIDEGFIKNIEQPVLSFFDDCEAEELFHEKKNIKIRDLLSMQSGIEWNNRALIKDEWWFSDSPHCFVLNNFPMDSEPGTKFSYNSAVSHLLSGIISRSSGISTKDFATKYLFDPLEIKGFYWQTDNAGEYRGNSELYLLPRDMIKIGETLLNEGLYKKNRVVSKSWIAQMTSYQTEGNSLMDYGFHWMLSKDDKPSFFFAGGSGGHHIFVVPSKELVVVTTGHWDNARSTLEIMQAVKLGIIEKLNF